MVVGRIAAAARVLLSCRRPVRHRATTGLALVVLIVLLGCGGRDVGPAKDLAPGEALVLTSREIPPDITALLSASAADSCGVCERENQADAFAVAEAWFAPGTVVRPVDGAPLRVLEAADHEVTFAPDDTTTARLSFRFHTADEHLIGIAPEDYTEADLAAAVLADPTAQPIELVVVPFDYGEGAGFLFDTVRRRIQVQCRIRTVDAD